MVCFSHNSRPTSLRSSYVIIFDQVEIFVENYSKHPPCRYPGMLYIAGIFNFQSGIPVHSLWNHRYPKGLMKIPRANHGIQRRISSTSIGTVESITTMTTQYTFYQANYIRLRYIKIGDNKPTPPPKPKATQTTSFEVYATFKFLVFYLHSWKRTARPWKWMGGRRSGFLLGFGLFSGANLRTLVSGRVIFSIFGCFQK